MGASRLLQRLKKGSIRQKRTNGKALLSTNPMTSKTSPEERVWLTHSSRLPPEVELTMLSWVLTTTSALDFASKSLNHLLFQNLELVRKDEFVYVIYIVILLINIFIYIYIYIDTHINTYVTHVCKFFLDSDNGCIYIILILDHALGTIWTTTWMVFTLHLPSWTSLLFTSPRTSWPYLTSRYMKMVWLWPLSYVKLPQKWTFFFF